MPETPAPKPTRGYIRDPQMKRLRAISMVRDKVMGMNKQELMEKYRVGMETVDRTLTYARRAGIIVEEMDTILQDMVPLARKVLVDALKDNDRGVALEVFKGTGLLGNKGKPSGANSDDDELMRSMHELRQRAQLLAETSEGELLDTRLPQRQIDGAGASNAGEAGLRQPAALPAHPETDRAALDPGPTAASPEEVREADDTGGIVESEFPAEPGRPGEPEDDVPGEGTTEP